jgi:hypothetical protein
LISGFFTGELPPPIGAPSATSRAACDEATRCRHRSRRRALCRSLQNHIDQAYLHEFVAELYLRMPTFRLSAEEQQDVIAYILSLRVGTMSAP